MSEIIPKTMTINTNTGVSLGLIVVGCGLFWAIMNGIAGVRSDVGTISNKLDKIESRVSVLETSKNGMSTVQFFQWAVHLQQLNNDPKKLQTEGLKVPEPELNNK